jgi:hypothetical protein
MSSSRHGVTKRVKPAKSSLSSSPTSRWNPWRTQFTPRASAYVSPSATRTYIRLLCATSLTACTKAALVVVGLATNVVLAGRTRRTSESTTMTALSSNPLRLTSSRRTSPRVLSACVCVGLQVPDVCTKAACGVSSAHLYIELDLDHGSLDTVDLRHISKFGTQVDETQLRAVFDMKRLTYFVPC